MTRGQASGKHGLTTSTNIYGPNTRRRNKSSQNESARIEKELIIRQETAIRSTKDGKYAISVDTSKARSNIDVVRMCIKELGWKEVISGRSLKCDIYWNSINYYENPDITSGHINKFPGIGEILGKINLFRTLDLLRSFFPHDFDFYPRTWLLPQEYALFATEARAETDKHPRRRKKRTFIVKPDEGSQGEGIYLIKDPADYHISPNHSDVIQEYLGDPFLIDNYKFDLRIYIVLHSIEPLSIYICKEGLARFCTIPYKSPTNKNLHEAYMHLTNYSLNKRSKTFNLSDRDDEGSKRTFSSVLKRLESYGCNTERLVVDIESLVVKTMIALLPQLKVANQAEASVRKHRPSSFQILGFDILLLSDLKPMLLEVNCNPSLRIDTETEISPGVLEYTPSMTDKIIKCPLIRDTMILIAPPSKLKYYKNKRKRRKMKQLLERVAAQRPNSTPCPPVCLNRDQQVSLNRDQPVSLNRDHPTARIIIFGEDDENDNDNDNDKPIVKWCSEQTNEEKTTHLSSIDNVDLSNDACDETEEENEDMKFSGDEEVEEEEIESCLKVIYPDMYATRHEHLRLFERVSGLFIKSLGIKATLRIGPTAFRMFTRKCRLTKKGLTNAAIDILYIDMQRKWYYMNPDRTAGLCYQGFVDAFIEIAKRKFYSENPLEMVENLVDFCEANMDYMEQEKQKNQRLLSRRAPCLVPRVYCEQRIRAEVRKSSGAPPASTERVRRVITPCIASRLSGENDATHRHW